MAVFSVRRSWKNLFFPPVPQNFAALDLISWLTPSATNCPNKSIPNAEKRRREASPDVLKGSRLIRVSAPTNREERNDRGKDGGEDRRWQRSGKQSGGMESLWKVNEQKDNVLAPNPTLSPSQAWWGGFWEEAVRPLAPSKGCRARLEHIRLRLTARTPRAQNPK